MSRLALVALVVAACEPAWMNPGTLDCSEAATPPSATILTAGDGVPLVDDLTVVGTSSGGDGGAILLLAVGGQPARSTAGNYATWSVVIDHADLVAMRDRDNRVRLPVFAQDVCALASEWDCGAADGTCIVVEVDPTATPRGADATADSGT